MASASAVPSSSSRHIPLSVVKSGMKLRDLYAITRSNGLAQWLRCIGLIGNLTNKDCVKCNNGWLRMPPTVKIRPVGDFPTGNETVK